MKINNYTNDKIQQMIKKKIIITDPNYPYQNAKQSHIPIHLNNKPFNKHTKSPSKKLNNHIVIMNMPPSHKLQLLQNHSHKSTHNQSPNHHQQYKTPFFNNPHINLGINPTSNHTGIQKFHSLVLNNQYKNKQNVQTNNSNQYQLKRYNSLNIKYTIDDKSNKHLVLKNVEFKPSFKQLLKKNSKIHSQLQNKLKKSQFNYQRAITTSSLYRKKAFQKILIAYQQNYAKRSSPNPQTKIKMQNQSKFFMQKFRLSRQMHTRNKTTKNSPQHKQRLHKKVQQTCRPWSAGKKNLIKLQNTQQQHPLNFDSMNVKY